MPWGATKGLDKKPWDGDGVPIEDSNMAGVGGEEDKAVRKGAAEKEEAWKGVGLEPGLWVWRIESFKVVPWPKEKYGQFHEGDSYIILSAEKEIGEDGKETEKLERDIHFWLGKKTSTDEKGTAAYKTVELDDFFDGEPTQHREVQGIESEQFLEYFGGEVKYLAGGVDSGFAVVQSDIFITKLYQFRRNAKKKVIMEEEAVARASMNHRDAFILDTGKKLYVWVGDSCSPFVKGAANSKAENWESERNGDASVVHEMDAAFWEALGGEGDITSADAVGAEVEADFGEGVLYSVNVDESRALTVKEVGRSDLKKSMLDTTAIMMLDNRVEVFMWCGKEASKIEQRSAMPTAVNYLKTNGRNPDETAIHIIKEGHCHKNKIWAKTFAD
jgi:gelsolin